jgi:hypothetical protein
MPMLDQRPMGMWDVRFCGLTNRPRRGIVTVKDDPSLPPAVSFLLRCTTHPVIEDVVGCALVGGRPMRRRDFITLLGSAVTAWPFAARAQQRSMPVIGLLNGVSNEAYADRIAAIRQGLKETGFVEGRNVAIEYRSADSRPERLPGLAAELVRRQVSAIVAIGATPSPLAAKEATSSIPVVFAFGGGAIRLGLVANLSRPGGNLTGMSFNNGALAPKRLDAPDEIRVGDQHQHRQGTRNRSAAVHLDPRRRGDRVGGDRELRCNDSPLAHFDRPGRSNTTDANEGIADIGSGIIGVDARPNWSER